ncbi:hypothetical protein VFPBJ_01068 [Purpureocillium lilacinum]|uniref:Uncharacterized protein n=1 Tax=Purpureocillium lilacinum TaxID=33203 RepID=A0A179HBL8_PURLI|nr:hypothetical protein VFPBJ_01068 [Purpureocillium lilacinum]
MQTILFPDRPVRATLRCFSHAPFVNPASSSQLKRASSTSPPVRHGTSLSLPQTSSLAYATHRLSTSTSLTRPLDSLPRHYQAPPRRDTAVRLNALPTSRPVAHPSLRLWVYDVDLRL